MTKIPTNALTAEAAVKRLKAFKLQAGSGDIPFLAESTDPKELQLCDVRQTQAGASDVFRIVSRGGVPVVNVSLYVPLKEDTESKVAWLTLDEALARLEAIQEVAGGATPVLTSAPRPWAMQFCDLVLGRRAVGKVYSQVSRGGLPVVLVKSGLPVPA